MFTEIPDHFHMVTLQSVVTNYSSSSEKTANKETRVCRYNGINTYSILNTNFHTITKSYYLLVLFSHSNTKH